MIDSLDILSHLKLLSQLWIYYPQKISLINEAKINHYLKIINSCQNCQNTEKNLIIFIAETKEINFISAFFAGIISQSCIFLINPHWQQQEWQQVEKIVTPDIIFGEINYPFTTKPEILPKFEGIMIPTGGTSGKIKFAIHTWKTLTASAIGFYQYFDSLPINSYCCLPLYHVSGLMQIIRSFISKGNLIINSFSSLKNSLDIIENYHDYFISLVPTQLQFFLDNKPEYLKLFKIILVGGASIYPQQIDLANKYKLPLALTYGMTETASGISILTPDKLVVKNNSNGQILPHAEIVMEKETKDLIKIKSPCLFKGYYPHFNNVDIFITDDVGYLDEDNFLYILGRNSQKIITGGENVFPLEIETAILSTGLVKDIHITATKDNYWGEVITAFYVPLNNNICEEDIKLKLACLIANYKIPKIWHKLDIIPRNSQGKIKFSITQTIVET
ncbi:AMP-binding protein [Geminocystis herdmanii]|uniref:AMP-binding protein n=1 Tax=Geminocystis herdmanii TaxID=669359 RepID=UPI00034B9FA8|nr:AMP-binding protein [Geminocystis herdmanii]